MYCEKIRSMRKPNWKPPCGGLGRIYRGQVMLVSLALSAAAFGQPIYYSFSTVPTTNWVSYSVPLVETSGWAVGSPGGPAPTQAQFQSILGSLDALLITLNGNPAEGFLDNVSLVRLATSTFDGCPTADGWTSSAGLGVNCVIGNPPPSIDASGGLGVYSVSFEAPGKFLGNELAAYGGNLMFDLELNLDNTTTTNCVITLVQTPSAAAAGPHTAFEWGAYNFGGGLVPPGLTNVAEIAAGPGDALALRRDGTVAAWGANNNTLTNVPAGLTNAIAVAAGVYHNLALRNDGTVAWWGTTAADNTPPSGLSNVVAICAGYNRSLALRSDGTVIGWGYGFPGGATNPPPGLSNVVAIATGQNGTESAVNLALRRDGSVVGWVNVSPETNSVSYVTNLPTGLTNVIAVAAGGQHLLALKDNGTVVAWGNNGNGQTNVPPGLSNIVAVAGGNSFSLALRRDGTVIAWGDTTYNETTIPAGLSNVIGIAGGGNNALVLIGNAPPQEHATLASAQWTNGLFSVATPSECGRVYALEYTLSLTAPNWTPLPLVAGTGGLLTLSDATAAAGQRFYRVRRW